MGFFNKIVDILKQLRNKKSVKYFVWMSHKPTYSTKMCVMETGSPRNWQVGGSSPHKMCEWVNREWPMQSLLISTES